ncbi:PA0069 family radical SAM protein [Rhodobacteraceae bacterium 2CG4]|uniref:PA0069 family radical SAM protein n=1 Tax=Halovulum marinum TaxID=2662447 RepID=A0A6L5Z502_9RHOB|nr:PA0069 family radical SAM protein [Halovulum marinum]MSU91389.1 PA0069 family radical SAM protein [Halovulum marinum]
MSKVESDRVLPGAARGRGALSNAPGRFEPHRRLHADDGWGREPEPQVRTQVTEDGSRSILARNTSPDIPFDRSINPYRGCEHGCIYCFARPSHAYLGLSPGLDFETRLFSKPRAPELLRKALSARRYRPDVIAIGTNTDPYQPVEQRLQIMRGVLEVLNAFRHPVSIVTKGALIRRDLGLLAEMAADGLAHVGVSLTTLDPKLSRRMEPRAAAPAHRLRSIGLLAEAGIPVRAMIAPVVPGLTDHELESLMQAAADAGATAASYIVLRLPLEVSPLFREWLEEVYPDRARRVMGRVRELHGGRDYDPEWGRRMRGQGLWADLLAKRFAVALGRTGLSRQLPALRRDLFRVPPRPGEQLSLF